MSFRLTLIIASAIELFFNRIWYRTLAMIWRIFFGGPSLETCAKCPSPAMRLPLEVVEMITIHLSCDMRSLRACTLTCYSWYAAAVPHLHSTLISSAHDLFTHKKSIWPKPLTAKHKLGLLPFVRELHIHRRVEHHFSAFSPERFSSRTLRHFLALTKVQELEIDYLDIPSFMPKIHQYFGHFMPTVRSLALGEPQGTRREIIYFIGLFQHLDDLKLLNREVKSQVEPVEDTTLIPPFVPPLRGQLTAYCTRIGLLKDVVQLFGRVRFRHMDLYDVDAAQLLIDTCAETLETLRMYPPNLRYGVALSE